jgi:hypothetical protein
MLDIGSILFMVVLFLPVSIPLVVGVMYALNFLISYVTAGDYDEVFICNTECYGSKKFKGIKVFGKDVEMFTDFQGAAILISVMICTLYFTGVHKANQEAGVNIVFNNFTGTMGCLMLLFLAIWVVLFFLRTTYVTGKKVKQIKNHLTDHINDPNAHN